MRPTKVLAGLLVLGGILALPLGASAVGIVSQPIEVDEVRRGQVFEEKITLFNSSSSEARFELTDEGDIKDWATFFETQDSERDNPVGAVTVPPSSYYSVVAKFKVPEGTPNGTHEGRVVALSVPEDQENEEGVGAGVRERVGQSVAITVTDTEKVDLNMRVTPESFDVTSNGVLKVEVKYENNGNVTLSPDLEFSVHKSGEEVHRSILPYPSDLDPVPTLGKTTLPEKITWSAADQPSGEYKARLVALNDDVSLDKEEFRFTVGLTSSNSLSAFLGSLGGGNPLSGGLLVLGTALLLVAVVAVWGKRFGVFKRAS